MPRLLGHQEPGVFLLLLPSSVITHVQCAIMPSFLVGVGNLNPDPHACPASIFYLLSPLHRARNVFCVVYLRKGAMIICIVLDKSAWLRNIEELVTAEPRPQKTRSIPLWSSLLLTFSCLVSSFIVAYYYFTHLLVG